MAVLQAVTAVPGPADPLVVRLASILAELGTAVVDDTEVADADRVDRIAVLERLRAVTAALQAAECVRFAQSQVAEQLAAEVHPGVIGRGIADQIALACHLSPTAGSRRLASARAWWFDLPGTYRLLAAGEVSEQVAEIAVAETRHLDAATRRGVDAAVVAAGLATLGVRAAAACVRGHAYRADREAYVERGRTERRHRRVGLRPAPDTMAVLTGYLPVEQGVACLAALRRHTDTLVADGDGRTRDQIMADTLVERVTGQARAVDVPVEVELLMPLETLVDPESGRPAVLAGAGPLPAELARELLADSQGRRWWRRLFTAPTGELVGGDPRRRRFDGWMATLVRLRDQHCRDPWCDSAIRHLDHIRRWSRGGTTTLANGRGTCARGNLVRELPGWDAAVMDSGLDGAPHVTITTGPTGHRYRSRAPAPP